MIKSSTTGWGYFQQGADQMQEIMELGEKLSIAINCPIHYPAFGKNVFECQCEKLFPVYVVKGHSVEELVKMHRDEN